MLASPRGSGLDVFMFGIPLIVLLVFGYFRLDEIFTRKRPTEPAHKQPPTIHADPETMGSDPDGKPWEKPLARRY